MSYSPPTSLALRSPIYCPECMGLCLVQIRLGSFQLRHPYNTVCIRSGEIILHGASTDCIKTKIIGDGMPLIQLPAVPPRCPSCQHTYSNYTKDSIRLIYRHSQEYSCRVDMKLAIAQFTVWV